MSMDEETRKLNHEKLFKYITKYTAAYWGTSYVNELIRIKQDEDAKDNKKAQQEGGQQQQQQ